MAITDIVFNNSAPFFVNEIDAGTLNAPDDILFDERAILEIGPSYPDVDVIAQAIWEFEERSLTP